MTDMPLLATDAEETVTDMPLLTTDAEDTGTDTKRERTTREGENDDDDDRGSGRFQSKVNRNKAVMLRLSQRGTGSQ